MNKSKLDAFEDFFNKSKKMHFCNQLLLLKRERKPTKINSTYLTQQSR